MTKQILLAIATCIMFTACQDTTNNENNKDNQIPATTESQKEINVIDIPFTIAKNYFVKNTANVSDNPKIETAEAFDQVFGTARTMAEDSKSTEIDFTKHYVIAVILPKTDLATTISPVSLQKNENGEIVLTYKMITGEKQTFTTVPNFAVIVDKSADGKIILNEVK